MIHGYMTQDELIAAMLCLITVNLLFHFQLGANLTDFTFLYIDLVLLTTLSITCEFSKGV